MGTKSETKSSGESHESLRKPRASDSSRPAPPSRAEEAPREIGGRGGLDPVRYGDWEKNGRCIDF